MTRTVRVEVTAEDIAAGEAKSCTKCPIALAVSRAVGRDAWVEPGWITFGIGTTVVTSVETPAEALLFLINFDAGYSRGPFAFDLEVPE